MHTDKYIVIGKFGKTFGVHGWIKLYPYTTYAETLFGFKAWFISSDKIKWSAIDLESYEIHANHIIVKIKAYDSPEMSRQFTGFYIGVPRNQLPKLNNNEFYWSDLEGLTVVTQLGKILGTVNYLLETGSNDVLVVKGPKEIAIPYLFNEVILKVDLDKGTILVNWEEE